MKNMTEEIKHRNEEELEERNNSFDCEESIVAAVLHIACYIVALVIAMLPCIIFQGCSTPTIVEQHHYHESATDTAAVKALVDGRMTSWHQQIDSSWTQRWQQYVNEQSTEEHERERITETVTTFVDSLGREVRQEQRTTERDMTRQQQQREERLAQEWESRLQRALDERDSAWQEKLEAIAVHQEQKDSTSSVVTPAPEDNRPWYRRWWDNMQWLALGGAVVLLLLLTRGMWQKVLKK